MFNWVSGKPTTLHACLENNYSSVLEPFPQLIQQTETKSPTQVLAQVPIPTIALDKIEGLASLDVLILEPNQ